MINKNIVTFFGWLSSNFYNVLVLALLLIYLSPIIQPVYFSDDAFIYLNALIETKLHGQWAWFYKSNDEISRWARENGRFTPLGAYTINFLIYNFQPLAVKGLYFLGTCAALAVGGAFMKKLLKNFNFSLFLLMALGSIQFCIRYHDAYNSFGLLYHAIVVFNFSSLYFLLDYIEKNETKIYILSIFLYLLALLYQEISLIFLPIQCILIWWRGKNYKLILPYFIIGGIYFLFLMYLKVSLDPRKQYEGLRFVLEPSKNLYVFYSQLLGAIPLRNSFCVYFDVDVYADLIRLYWMKLIFIFCSALYILFHYLKQKSTKINKNLIAIALLLMTLPALAISFSMKYIDQVSEVNFYIPVFIQIFGTAMLLYTFYMRYYPVRIFLVVFFPALISLSFLTNETQILKGHKAHFRHTNLMRELKQISETAASRDTIYAFDLWTDETTLTRLTELYFHKTIVYKNLYQLDTNRTYSRLLIYSYKITPRYIHLKNYRYKKGAEF